MKKRSLKSLALNKRAISSLETTDQSKGGASYPTLRRTECTCDTMYFCDTWALCDPYEL